jgi:hypothetical protein
VVAPAHALPVKAARAAAQKAVLKEGADKDQSSNRGLAVTVAEAVGRGAAKITNVLSSLTGEGRKLRGG